MLQDLEKVYEGISGEIFKNMEKFQENNGKEVLVKSPEENKI